MNNDMTPVEQPANTSAGDGLAISLADVQSALQKCLAAHPPEGLERVLCRDASLIADVFGDMLYFKETNRPMASIRSDRMSAIEHWLAAGSGHEKVSNGA